MGSRTACLQTWAIGDDEVEAAAEQASVCLPGVELLRLTDELQVLVVGVYEEQLSRAEPVAPFLQC